jgi:hypothetical protein
VRKRYWIVVYRTSFNFKKTIYMRSLVFLAIISNRNISSFHRANALLLMSNIVWGKSQYQMPDHAVAWPHFPWKRYMFWPIIINNYWTKAIFLGPLSVTNMKGEEKMVLRIYYDKCMWLLLHIDDVNTSQTRPKAGTRDP